MRRFALLSSALLLVLAAFATVLPSADAYVPGEDDGPTERFKTIAEAEKAAGFDFPDAGTPRGWEIADVNVTPVYYFRRLLSENSELALKPLPNQGENARRVYWRDLPEPPAGVHNYVSIAYRSDKHVFIALNVNYPLSSRDIVPPTSEPTEKARQTVLIGSTTATMTTYTSRDVEVMFVAWRIDGTRVSATAYNFTPNPSYRMPRDEFVAFLNNVR